jgi:hypothetical protein
MTKYIIFEGDAYSILNIPDLFNSGDFGVLQKRFAEIVGVVSEFGYATMFRLWEFYCAFGVYWHEELASIHGCSFLLFATPETPEADLHACEEKIRKDRDVVRLRIVRLRRFIEPAELLPEAVEN